MSELTPRAAMAPQLSLSLRAFAADDPGSWQPMLDTAIAADRAGIDRVVVSDHVVYGENLDAYADPARGVTAGGTQPTGPDGHWLEPLTVLSVVAGLTSRVRLGTNILLAALRPPAVLAKTLATLDVLSNGRVDLGVGVGWQREEYEVNGLDYTRRGKILDRNLEICQRLWREQVVTFDDGTLRFDRIHAMPKPRQPGGVPVWVSGTVNQATARRLARFGSGWIPWGADAAHLDETIPRMRDAVIAAGGPATFGVVGTLRVRHTPDKAIDVDATVDAVPAMLAAGITDVRVFVALPPGVDAAVDVLAPLVEGFRQVSGTA